MIHPEINLFVEIIYVNDNHSHPPGPLPVEGGILSENEVQVAL